MSKKVLIAEDSDVGIAYLKELFEKIEDVSCDYAKSFDDAVACCKDNEYDLFLIDYFMPDGTGDALLTKLRNLPEYEKDTKAVVMGSPSDFAEEGMLSKYGFSNYIEKPVKFNMLLGVLTLYAGYGR